MRCFAEYINFTKNKKKFFQKLTYITYITNFFDFAPKFILQFRFQSIPTHLVLF